MGPTYCFNYLIKYSLINLIIGPGENNFRDSIFNLESTISTLLIPRYYTVT